MATQSQSAERPTLALEVARRLLAGWSAHTGQRSDGFKVTIHVLPGQQQAKIEWPPPPADEVRVGKESP